MAWLQSCPNGAEKSRGEFFRGIDPDNPVLDLPDVGSAEYLLQYFFDVGTGSFDRPLTWQELYAWRECTGVLLSEFEASAIMDMSRAYLSMLHKGSEKTCPNPRPGLELTPAYRAALSEARKQAASARVKR